ncbi:efflux RND transporter periplasmic adaptor subunit [Rhodocyclaceae bacterium SMB388]
MKPALKPVLIVTVVTVVLFAGYLAGQSSSPGHPGHSVLILDSRAAEGPASVSSPATAAEASGAAAAATAAPAGAPGERVILYYRNPMGLPDTSPEPKKDSMGMDYIPVYADEQSDDVGTVRVSPARLQSLGVRTAPVERRVLDAALRAVGRIELDERRIHDVSPRFEGWIERLHVSATGDPVRKGQPLFTVYSPELASARQELAIAEQLRARAGESDPVARQGAQRLAEAARARLRNWQVGGGSVGAGGHSVVFSAPADGIVLEKAAVEGMRFTPGTPVYRIADLSTVWVLADVYEQDLARVETGQSARVGIDAFPGRDFDARITFIYPTLNAATRTTPVRLELANSEGLLRPGMFAHVELVTGGDASRLTVPMSAIIDDGQRRIVLVAEGEGRFRPQIVETGLRDRDNVEVLSGLEGDERVVVSANFLIDAESNLQAALANFGEGDPETGPARVETRGAFEDFFDDSNTVMLAHEDIPALSWPAMTMEFGLADPALVEGLAPGTPIRFAFEDRGNGEFVVVEIQSEAAAGAAPSGSIDSTAVPPPASSGVSGGARHEGH